MPPLTGLEFVTEIADLLVQVSRGSSVLRRLGHERKSLDDEERKQKR